jgi:hypothetical protein
MPIPYLELGAGSLRSQVRLHDRHDLIATCDELLRLHDSNVEGRPLILQEWLRLPASSMRARIEASLKGELEVHVRVAERSVQSSLLNRFVEGTHKLHVLPRHRPRGIPSRQM